jgi:signal transduction histidine kinase
MDLRKRSFLVFGLLLGVWLLVVAWQVEEHIRFKDFERTALRNRSKSIAGTLGASVRGLQFRGAVFGDRLQPVLNELINAPTNQVGLSGEVVAVGLLNAAGDVVASAGRPINLDQKEIRQENERWGPRTVTFVYPIEGAIVAQERGTNTIASPPVLLPTPTNSPRDGGRSFPRRDDRGGDRRTPLGTNTEAAADSTNPLPRPPPDIRPGESERPRRPFWARRLNDEEFQTLMQQRELHGLVLSMPIDAYQAAALRDLWLRCVIGFFATLSVLGAGVSWRNLTATSDLQLRLVRASELNTHLRQMNLAAAGLAHETRNPLNIIRGLAHMISKQPHAASEIQQRSGEIVAEADKVAAQLNEFINYSRPREVRRTAISIPDVANEVARALSYDLEEKKINLQVKGERLSIEADEQMLRQALFNLILNAIQAVDGDGEIQVVAEKRGLSEAVLEVRDNGPGVSAENRGEIFKPYFTTQKTGTGLGLAVVQQIVLAHGWEIQCLANEPKGAVFRMSHLKVAG